MLPDTLNPAAREWLDAFQIGMAASTAGLHNDACAHFERALDIAIQKVFSPDHVLNTYLPYGTALRDAGRLDDCEILLFRAINYGAENGRADSEPHMYLLAELGMLHFERGKYGSSHPFLQQSIDLLQRQKFRMIPEFAFVHLALATCYWQLNDLARAKRMYRTAYNKCLKARGPNHQMTLYAKQLYDSASAGTLLFN